MLSDVHLTSLLQLTAMFSAVLGPREILPICSGVIKCHRYAPDLIDTSLLLPMQRIVVARQLEVKLSYLRLRLQVLAPCTSAATTTERLARTRQRSRHRVKHLKLLRGPKLELHQWI